MSKIKKTHRLVNSPKISAKNLADYMAGSERARRSLIRKCRFQPIARIIQHQHAKNAINNFFLKENCEVDFLKVISESLRNRISDSDFDQTVFDNNADYIDAFSQVALLVDLPNTELYELQEQHKLEINGVSVNPDVRIATHRVTRTNKVRTGLISFRYAKGKELKEEVANWQSSFLFGYRMHLDEQDQAEAEKKLCITIDAYTGKSYPAPGDALSRFKNIEAACLDISERWDHIKPPEGAVY